MGSYKKEGRLAQSERFMNSGGGGVIHFAFATVALLLAVSLQNDLYMEVITQAPAGLTRGHRKSGDTSITRRFVFDLNSCPPNQTINIVDRN